MSQRSVLKLMKCGKMLNDTIAAVKVKFLQNLAKEIPDFENLANQIKEQRVSDSTAATVRTKAHKIAGTAEMFGFKNMTNLAAEIEASLEKFDEVKSGKNFLEKVLEKFIQEAKEAVKDNNDKAPDDDHIEPAKKNSLRILLVDDDEVIQKLLIKAAQKTDYEILIAEDGEQAIELLKNQEVALIILAVNIPKLSGMEVLERIKSDKKTSLIPVIMLTNISNDKVVVGAISKGAAEYITKPFEIDFLFERISQIAKHHKIKIMVVDDDELVRDLLAQHFRHQGYIVSEVSNGKDVVKSLEWEFPDLILLDIMMPGMDGLAVLRKLKSNPKTKNIATIILSAKNQQENILSGLESGADDYIVKPFDINEVIARTHIILRRKNNE